GRIKVDENKPELGGGILGNRPFRAVRRPQADAVASHQTELEQTGGESLDLACQLCIAPGNLLMADNKRGAIAMPINRPVEGCPDRICQQWSIDVATDIAGGRAF